MIKIESLYPVHASALNALIKLGLREHPASFTSDISSIENRPDHVVADHLESLQTSDDFRLGALTPEGELVGTVRLIRHQNSKLTHSADIVFVFVHPDYQNQGIGLRLMHTAIEKAREITGLEHLHLAVSTDSLAAIHLYEKAGFESTGIIKQQIKTGGRYYDQLTMWKSLRDA